VWWLARHDESPWQVVSGHPGLETAARPARLAWGRVALLASVLAILVATLSPGEWTQTEGRPEGLDGRLADVLLNLALFAPFGAALGQRGRSVRQALALGTLLSGAVELAQLWVPGRTAGLSDVVVNAAGTVLGWAVWRTTPVWAAPSHLVAGRLAMTAAVVASATIGLTGLLLEPMFPTTPYFAHWTPEFGHLRTYGGRVQDTSVGGVKVSPGVIKNVAGLRSSLRARESVRVTAVAGPAVAGLAPIVSINDWQREIVLVGLDGEDLVYRFRTRGASLGLDSPELRVAGALRGVHAGDRLAITVTPERRAYCVDVNGTVTCGVGYTAAMGWALLMYGQGIPPAFHWFFSILWLAGLALPVGYWSRMHWQSVVAGAVLVAGLLLLPAATGLAPTTWSELAWALVGLLVGTALQVFSGDNSPSGSGRTP